MVNIDNYEHFKEFNDLPNKEKVDWYYFTDNDNMSSDFWIIKNINKITSLQNLNNRLKSKYIKMNTHKLLPDYNFYFWIDGSFSISNFNFINDLFNLTTNNLILYLHNSRPKERNIRGEVSRCSKLKSVNKDKLNLQLKSYLDDKYPDKKGNLYSSGIILKKNDIQINQMMDFWYLQNITFTSRDQISLPYSLWKNKIKPSLIIKENINLNTLVGKKQMKPRRYR